MVKKKKPNKTVILTTIKELFKFAETMYPENKALANRYVFLARKLAMKHNVSIPSTYQRQFCKHCYSFLMPGSNCRVRMQSSKLVYYCLDCKKFTRIPLKPRKGTTESAQ